MTQPLNYINLRSEFIDYLTQLSSDEIRVFLALMARSDIQKNLKTGLTLNELARSCDLSSSRTWLALRIMTGRNFYIKMDPLKTARRWRITLDPFWVPDATEIPFTEDNTDETKIKLLEDEVRRLNNQLKHMIIGEKSGLDGQLTNLEERDMIVEIESDLGRGLTVLEAFRLGQVSQAFMPSRVKEIWRKKAARAKSPVPALVSILWKGGAGKPAAPREYVEPTERIYPDL